MKTIIICIWLVLLLLSAYIISQFKREQKAKFDIPSIEIQHALQSISSQWWCEVDFKNKIIKGRFTGSYNEKDSDTLIYWDIIASSSHKQRYFLLSWYLWHNFIKFELFQKDNRIFLKIHDMRAQSVSLSNSYFHLHSTISKSYLNRRIELTNLPNQHMVPYALYPRKFITQLQDHITYDAQNCNNKECTLIIDIESRTTGEVSFLQSAKEWLETTKWESISLRNWFKDIYVKNMKLWWQEIEWHLHKSGYNIHYQKKWIIKREVNIQHDIGPDCSRKLQISDKSNEWIQLNYKAIPNGFTLHIDSKHWNIIMSGSLLSWWKSFFEAIDISKSISIHDIVWNSK